VQVPPDFLRGFNASGFVVPTPDLYGVLHNSDFWVTNEGITPHTHHRTRTHAHTDLRTEKTNFRVLLLD
jgi:hypothetical protein